MSMNPLDEECVQVSVVPLLGTAVCHGTKCDVHSSPFSHDPITSTVAPPGTPRGPLRQTYPTRKLWDRLLPETRILETDSLSNPLSVGTEIVKAIDAFGEVTNIRVRMESRTAQRFLKALHVLRLAGGITHPSAARPSKCVWSAGYSCSEVGWPRGS